MAMFQNYQPALSEGVVTRDELIQKYFNLRYTYKEIQGALLITHGIRISVRHIKRILKNKGLRRRLPGSGESPIEQIITAIDIELKGSGQCLGYRTMWKRLITEHKLYVKRDTVLELLWLMDPEGVQRRKSRRLMRRKYFAPGPNFVWHVDGYDKLKPFGFPIHGAIDGFSRRILWLQVARSNNDPVFIASHYLQAVKQLKCVPRILRCDNGTENAILKYFQPFFRAEDEDRFAGANSIIFGRSTSNQRIESWWSILRKQNADWWIATFKDLRDQGIYKDHLPLHKECLKFCFMSLIQRELDRVAIEWNTHVITSKKNAEGPKGKPDIMYFNPEIYDTHDYHTLVNVEDVNAFMEVYGTHDLNNPCMPEFMELVDIVKPDLTLPTCVDDAKLLFIELTSLFDTIDS